MKFHQLTYFMEAARQEHIGRAAKTLAISPSAISHSIASLEEELGRELFTKQGKRISLTNHGKLLLERVTRLFGELDSIKGELSSEEVDLIGSYRFAASHLLAPELLLPAWSELVQQAPKITAEIYTLRSADVLTATRKGEIDLGVCFSPQPHASVVISSLYEGELVIVVRPGHPCLSKKAPEDRMMKLRNYPAVLPKSFQGIDNCESHPVLERYGLPVRVEMVFDSYEVALKRVAKSDSWSFVPDWFAGRSKLISVRAPEGSAPYNISAVWPRIRPPTRALTELLSHLKSKINAVN